MRFVSTKVTNPIWYTTVLGVTIYVLLFLITYIWIQHAGNREEFPSLILNPLYIGLSLHQILSIVNMTWLLFLVIDLFSALRLLAHPRKGKLRGIVLRLVHCQTIFAIFMLLCYHWIPIYLLVQIQLTLMEWSIQCVSKNIK